MNMDGRTPPRSSLLPTALANSLQPHAVHLWWINLEAESAGLEWRGMLSEEERQRAERFVFEADRRRFTCAHLALRAILADYLEMAPADIQLETGVHGKPRLTTASMPADGGKLYFNLSHSHERALLAITEAGEIGVDVERIRPLDNLDELGRACFSRRERMLRDAALDQLADDPQRDRLLSAELRSFFTLWTRKEALLKGLGEGLLPSLEAFDTEAMAAGWTLRNLEKWPGYAAAFAVQTTGIIDVQFQEWL